MAANPSPSPLVVPPEIVTELRKALLKDLKRPLPCCSRTQTCRGAPWH
jgi:hypothetical protein